MDVKEAIKTAIQMEKDGHAFYKKAAAQTNSELAQKIFKTIAQDELVHLRSFEKLFDDIVSPDELNELKKANKKYADLPVFPKDLKQAEGLDIDNNELDALSFAMDAEKEAIEFYATILEQAKGDEAKKIISTVIEMEKTHYMILNEEFYHLSHMGYYFGIDVQGG